MVDEDIDNVFMIELASFILGDNGKGLIKAISDGTKNEYCNKMLNFTQSDEFLTSFEEKRTEFLKLLVSSYDDNDFAMEEDNYIEGLLKILEIEEPKLTSDKVYSIYDECLFRKEEIAQSNIPLVPFVVGKGVNENTVFNCERLALCKKNIIEMIDELEIDDSGSLFTSLFVDKNGRLWTGEYNTIDMLVQLGVAAEALFAPFPKNICDNDIPIIVRNRSKDDAVVRQNKPGRVVKLLERTIKKI